MQKRFLNSDTILLEANIDNYAKLIDWLDKKCDDVRIESSYKTKLNIAVEEIFANVANYAYPTNEGNVKVEFKIIDVNQVKMRFIDAGTQYNPLEKEDPDVTLGVEDRPIGGLGIFMVKNYMDEVNYAYEHGNNILTIKMIMQ